MEPSNKPQKEIKDSKSHYIKTTKDTIMTTRREFLTGVTLGTVSILGWNGFSKSAEQSQENPLGSQTGETIIFGKTGLKVGRIGLGAARFTKDKTDEEAARLVNLCLDSGMNLVDTACNYGDDWASWRVLGKVFKTRKRDDFILSNKLEWIDEEINRLKLTKSIEEQVDISLKTMNVDYIDMYLVHCLYNAGTYEKLVQGGFIEDMIKVRDKGKVRFIGITGHCHPAMIQACKRYPEIEVVMGGQNVMREHFFFDRDAALLNDYAQRHNLGILVMKPMVVGAITKNRDVALKYTMTQPMAVPIPGMSEIEQVHMNLKAAQEFSALTPEQQQKWREPETILDGPACTNCKYCINGETDTIDIPQLILAAQYGERFGMKEWSSKDKQSKKLSQDLKKITPDMAKRYAQRCPLELPVEELLKKSAQYV